MIVVPQLPPGELKLSTAMGMLLDRVEGEVLARTPDMDLCAKIVMPGDALITDYGTEECGGFVWVRLVAVNVSERFPTQTTTPEICAHTLAYPVEIGCLRPAPRPETFLKDFDAPTPESMFDAASASYDDMDAMYATNLWAQKTFPNATMGSFTPLGPLGDVIGGVWTFTFGLAEG